MQRRRHGQRFFHLITRHIDRDQLGGTRNIVLWPSHVEKDDLAGAQLPLFAGSASDPFSRNKQLHDNVVEPVPPGMSGIPLVTDPAYLTINHDHPRKLVGMGFSVKGVTSGSNL